LCAKKASVFTFGCHDPYHDKSEIVRPTRVWLAQPLTVVDRKAPLVVAV